MDVAANEGEGDAEAKAPLLGRPLRKLLRGSVRAPLLVRPETKLEGSLLKIARTTQTVT
jgi:hypothetical protein